MEGSLVAYKVFTNGSTLQASEVNQNLMQQVTATFSNAAARNAAITFPVEGQITYLEDSNSYQYWNSSSWVGLVPQSENAIINGSFEIWQRGTGGFGLGALYNADRWLFYTGTSTNKSVSRQTATPGELNVPTFGDATFYWRYAETLATPSDVNALIQRIESVRTFSDQTVTLSFYARSTSASSTIRSQLTQVFGSGGSSDVAINGITQTLTTSWARYSQTFSVPSISGKTIGSNSLLQLNLEIGTNRIQNVDIWGVQIESGSIPTPFRRNASNVQGELEACQRFYFRTSPGAFVNLANGRAESSTSIRIFVPQTVTLRSTPAAIEFGGTLGVSGAGTATSLAIDIASPAQTRISATTSGAVTNAAIFVFASTSDAFIALNSEL
jgi:hypothetical protein